ncbi:LuxR C-terminal-related transcriptional regulator [Kitasatospora sp. NPDC097605]|uniref:helix-turn-helix domain-containing protein n=1 Tax=Kitasatospora sp. NPDC097605 TaxID=3157226 RepID=UPI00332A7439
MSASEPKPGDPLTERELKVMVGIANGRTRAAIAGELGVCPDTVRSAAGRARRKLGAGTDAQAVVLLFALRQFDLHEIRFPRELLAPGEVGASVQVNGGAVAV